MNPYSVPSSVPASTQTLFKNDFVDIFDERIIKDRDGLVFCNNLADYENENKYGNIFFVTW